MSTKTKGVNISIDRLTVTHYHGQVQDVNHIYPYGLAVNLATTYNAPPSVNPANPVENNYLFQTKKQEKTEKLYIDDFHARQYDPQLGQFLSVDAYNQFPSGYTGMGDNPVMGIDPSGNQWYKNQAGTILKFFDEEERDEFKDDLGRIWVSAGVTVGNGPDGGTPVYFSQGGRIMSLYGDKDGNLSVYDQDRYFTGSNVWYRRTSKEDLQQTLRSVDQLEMGFAVTTYAGVAAVGGLGVALGGGIAAIGDMTLSVLIRLTPRALSTIGTGGAAARLAQQGAATESAIEKEAEVVANAADKMITVYRVVGGEAGIAGRSWTPVDPRIISNYRALAGLPDGNTAQYLVKGQVYLGNISRIMTAEPLDGNPGGLIEFRINPVYVIFENIVPFVEH